MLFHLGYRYDGNGQVGVVVFKSTSTNEGKIFPMWWTCPSTIKWHGSTNPYLRWANKGCGHGNTESFSGRRICFNISNRRGLKFHPPTNNTEGPNKSIDNNTWTFRQVSLPEGLNLAKKQDLDKKWATFFYGMNIPFKVVQHPTFIKIMKATSKSWTYYKRPSYHGLHTYLC